MVEAKSQTITIKDEELLNLIRDTVSKTSDLKPAFDLIGEYFLGKIDRSFKDEVDPYDVPWKPLSPYTLALKVKQGKILKILQRTGYMRSTTYYSSTPTKLTIGLKDPKAYKHQTGKDTPMRQILGINEKDQRIIKSTIKDYLKLKSSK